VVEVVATQETKVSVTPAGGFAKVSEKCERKSQCISSTRYSDLWLAQNQINQPLINIKLLTAQSYLHLITIVVGKMRKQSSIKLIFKKYCKKYREIYFKDQLLFKFIAFL